MEAAAKKRARCSSAKGQGQNGTSRVTRPYPRGPSKGPLSNTQPLAPCGTQGVSQHAAPSHTRTCVLGTRTEHRTQRSSHVSPRLVSHSMTPRNTCDTGWQRVKHTHLLDCLPAKRPTLPSLRSLQLLDRFARLGDRHNKKIRIIIRPIIINIDNYHVKNKIYNPNPRPNWGNKGGGQAAAPASGGAFPSSMSLLLLQ